MNDKAKDTGKRGNVRVNTGSEHKHGAIIYPENAVIENLREDQIQRLERNGTATRTTDKPVTPDV